MILLSMIIFVLRGIPEVFLVLYTVFFGMYVAQVEEQKLYGRSVYALLTFAYVLYHVDASKYLGR